MNHLLAYQALKCHLACCNTVKFVLSGHSKRIPKIDYQDRLSLNAGQKVLQNAPREHSAILSTYIKPPFVFKNFVLSIFGRPFKTDFTVYGGH